MDLNLISVHMLCHHAGPRTDHLRATAGRGRRRMSRGTGPGRVGGGAVLDIHPHGDYTERLRGFLVSYSPAMVCFRDTIKSSTRCVNIPARSL